MNVYDYFQRQLGAWPKDRTLVNLPCDSPCGTDCIAAIDAAKAFLVHARRASAHAAQLALQSVNETVETFWRG